MEQGQGEHPYGFQIAVGLVKPTKGYDQLYFGATGQEPGPKNIWLARNFDTPAPIGKWFTLTYYFKDGDQNNGRFTTTIQLDGEQPIKICDVADCTHHPLNPASQGMEVYNPLKLYTSSEVMEYMKSKNKPLRIYWDDLKVWRD